MASPRLGMVVEDESFELSCIYRYTFNMGGVYMSEID